MLMPPGIAMWLPNLVFLVLALLFIRSVAGETYTVRLEKFYDFTYAIHARMPWRRRRMR
jgi:hypothetical protein